MSSPQFEHCSFFYSYSVVPYRHIKHTGHFLGDTIPRALFLPSRADALLDLLLTGKEDLSDDAKVKGSLGCSGHEVVEFKILRGVRQTAELQPGFWKRRFYPPQGPAWQHLTGNYSGQRGPEELAGIQGQLPRSRGRVHSNRQS